MPTFGSHVALARPGAALSEGRLPRLAEDRPGRRLPGRSRGGRGQGTEDRGWGGDCCVTILTEDIYIKLSTLDKQGEAVNANFILQSWSSVPGQNIGLSERTMERNR